MKGITPIISIIILLLITISLAGVAYLYMSGWLTAITGKSFTIPPGGAYCVKTADPAPGKFKVVVTVSNTGSSALQAADFIVKNIDGVGLSVVGPIETGKAKKIVDNDIVIGAVTRTTAPVTLSAGKHTVNVGTGSHVEHVPVMCS